MDSWHKCKNNKHSNDKKIIEKSPKKVVFVKVEQRKISVSEIVQAYQSGELKEVFGTGTAVTVIPINSITYRKDRMNIETVEDSFAIQLKQKLQGIQKGEIEDIYDWTVKVPSKISLSQY